MKSDKQSSILFRISNQENRGSGFRRIFLGLKVMTNVTVVSVALSGTVSIPKSGKSQALFYRQQFLDASAQRSTVHVPYRRTRTPYQTQTRRRCTRQPAFSCRHPTKDHRRNNHVITQNATITTNPTNTATHEHPSNPNSHSKSSRIFPSKSLFHSSLQRVRSPEGVSSFRDSDLGRVGTYSTYTRIHVSTYPLQIHFSHAQHGVCGMEVERASVEPRSVVARLRSPSLCLPPPSDPMPNNLPASACSPCRDDIECSPLVDKERQTRRDEVAIDLEDRGTKKGTPPMPIETGDIRALRGPGAAASTRPAPMVE